MNIGTRIELSDELLAEAYELGLARHQNNRDNGVPITEVDGDKDMYLADQEGVAGEFAFAQMIDADESDWEQIRKVECVSAARGEDQGDCTYNGFRWDVKTTKWHSGHALIMSTKLLTDKIDGYVLVTGEAGNYVFRGCISHARVLRGIRQGTIKIGSLNTYWVKQSELRPLPTYQRTDKFDDYTASEIAAFKKWRRL